MRKTFLKVSLLAVLGLGMSASFTSCKDYDSEIDDLQSQLNQLKSTVDKINADIAGGAVITSVSQNADGVTFTLSNNQTYTVTNGKDGAAGKDADVWTIEKNAEGALYWAKNGVITEYPAQGPAGTAEPGICYVPNEDGFFYEYNPATGESKKTDIEWRSKGGNLSAVADGEKVILSGFLNENGEEDQVTIWRSMFVKGLVVKPELYLDGIEATRYDVAKSTRTLKVNNAGNGGQAVGEYKGAPKGAVLAAGQPSNYEFVKNANGTWNTWSFNEIATLKYGLNPDNAVVEGMKWNLLFDDMEVVNRSSNVYGEVLGTPEKDGNGNITITYQLGNTQYLAPYEAGVDGVPSWAADNNNWTMMALQAANMETDSALVVSDNVLVLKNTVYPVHLLASEAVWNASGVQRYHTANSAEAGIRNLANDDEKIVVNSSATVYPEGYETPYKSPAPVFEIAYNQTYDLAKHISIETAVYTPMIDGNEEEQKDNIQNTAAGKWKTNVISLAEAAKKYNLTASFKAVTYTVNPNSTSEDMFAQVSPEGVVTPCWVNENGQSVAIPGTAQGRSAIGRMPLVYVTLTAADGRIILAGYVKLVYGEPEREVPGIVVDSKRIPYVCDYSVSSNWDKITSLVYEHLGIAPAEFTKSFVFQANEVYVNYNGEMIDAGTAFAYANGINYIPTGYNLGAFSWTTDEDGMHTQKLTLTINQNQYRSWYPYKDANGIWQVNGNPTTESVSKTLYAKFRNEDTNTNVYIGFDVTVIGAPAANYTGKLVSQWSTDLEVAPINPAVPGQTTDETPVQKATGYTFASAMSMNFTSVWNGGQPQLTNYADEYNFTNAKAPYLLGQFPAQYCFAAAQDTVSGVSGTKYAIGLYKKLKNNGADLFVNSQALYAAVIGDNGKADTDNAQPIAVITSSNEVTGIAARAEALNAGSTTAPWRWEVISMLPYYNESTNSTAPYTPSYDKTIGSTGWKYAEYACDIVNAAPFTKNAPAITFNVEMRVNYSQVATNADGAYEKDAEGKYVLTCELVIPGKYDLKVGVGRPVALNKANEGELQDAVDGSVLASKLFSMVDWQGHLLWNTSRNGTVTANTFNNTNLAKFWLSQDGFEVKTSTGVNWPDGVTLHDKDNTPIKGAAIVIDLKNALVGNSANVAEKLGKFHEVYVDKELTLECSTAGIVNDNIASFADVELLDDITIEWENNGSAVTSNIYVFVPIYINYVWGQDIFLGYATITVKPTLSE